MGAMTLPNFLIIGAAKSGTTAIYEYLKLHPEVFMSKMKEPNFFSLKNPKFKFDKNSINESYLNSFIYNLENYSALFSEGKDFKMRGEASPIYLYDEHASEEIFNMIPNVKLIIILRNPIERAFSNFSMHQRGNGLETTRDFIKALDVEQERIDNNWWWGFHYKKAGLYYEQLNRYYKLFKKNQLLVLLYEDFKNGPKEVYSEITGFLEINEISGFDFNKRHKLTEIPKVKVVEDLLRNKIIGKIGKNIFDKNKRDKLKQFIRSKNKYKPKITEYEFNYLADYYKNDVNNLSLLIKKDLSHWLVYK